MRELVRCHSWFKGELNTYTYIGHKNADVNLDAKWINIHCDINFLSTDVICIFMNGAHLHY